MLCYFRLRAKLDASVPSLICQSVHTTWTKNSRGGEAAIKRNAVPDAFALTGEYFDSSCVTHSIECHEFSGFVPKENLVESDFHNVHKVASVQVAPCGDDVEVHYHRSPYKVYDGITSTIVFRLQPSEWGRVVFNRRRSDNYQGDWWYEKYSINIGWFDRFNAEVFRATVPTAVCGDMKTLL